MPDSQRSIALPIYTVYDHPTDYPDNFVVRLFLNDKPTDAVWMADSLEEAREIIQTLAAGSVCLHRRDMDDAKIVETWL